MRRSVLRETLALVLTLVHALVAQDIVAAEAAATMIATEKLGQALEWKN